MSQPTPPGMFSANPAMYDALIDWPKRLANEEPFYRRLFAEVSARRVLDVACGTGRHAAMFHTWGLEVEGADISEEMLAQCRTLHGENAGLKWVRRPFDQACEPAGRFDAVICTGNSLAIAESRAATARVIGAMMASVRSGGVCMVQILNLWRIEEGPTTWQKCKRAALGGEDHILLKSIHRAGDRAFIDLVDLRIQGNGVMERFDRAMFRGIESDELIEEFAAAGGENVRVLGSFQGEAYDRASSIDVIVVCRKK